MEFLWGLRRAPVIEASAGGQTFRRGVVELAARVFAGPWLRSGV